MINSIILHPSTEESLGNVLRSATHAIMLSGNKGSGKEYTATWLASKLLDSKLDNHPYFMHIKSEAGKAIGVDQVREIRHFVRLKTTGNANVKRVVLITDAHSMTIEAQNALLKLLEEPPEDTVLVLTVHSQKSLMPTIYSRVQQVHIKPITKQQALMLPIGKDKAVVERAYLLSKGDIGLLLSLLENDDSHELVQAIQQSKELLTETAFSRLQKIDSLSKDKEHLTNVLLAMRRICTAAIMQAAEKQNEPLFKRWQTSLEAVYDCEKSIKGNANVKLLLTDLFLTV